MIGRWIAGVTLAFVLAAVPLPATAEAPYQAYVYDQWKHSKASPNGYLPETAYTGAELGIADFNEPQDLFVDANQNVYIADTGNKRIVKLDRQFHPVDIIDKLSWQGNETALSRPRGVFVNEIGDMYIADEDRVLVVNPQKEVEMMIEKPSHPLIPDDFRFKPAKVASDNAGRIYVLSEGNFLGLLQFDPKGKFLGYFGSNKVEVTPYVVLETFWKRILTKEQRAAMAKLLPIEYSNLDIGPDDFVYTTTIVSKNSRNEIKKLNPLGNNVLTGTQGEDDFGDQEIVFKKGLKLDTSFVDLAVDGYGFIAALDRTKGRVFEYDQDGNPVTVFGAVGNQQGTFLQPAAVDYFGDSLLVLDSGKRNITRFVLTDYGRLVHQATVLYNQGMYEEAATIWRKVVKLNNNNRIANIGIAKALEKEENYEEALRYYKLGADRSGYSDAFSQLRIRAVRHALPSVMSLFAFVLVFYYGYKWFRLATANKFQIHQRRTRRLIPIQGQMLAFRCLLHPFDGFHAVKDEGKGSVIAAFAIVFVWFLAGVMERQNTGFTFNYNQLSDLNVFLILMKTVGLYALWVTCNWAVATWMDGEGKAKEIAIVSAYSITPYVTGILLATLVSNILLKEEGMFLQYITVVSMLWSSVIMFIGMLVVHDYGFVRTLKSLALTLAAMGIVVFLAVLFYTLFQQLYVFLYTVFNELLFRL
jgi:tetratricopeptide (TPR) repeat protein